MGQPIGEVGLAVSAPARMTGRIVLDRLGWDGTPDVVLRRPDVECDFWRRAWVNGADVFTTRSPQSFRLTQSHGEGLISCGTRGWADYRVRTTIIPHLGEHFGVAVRVQGLRRFYGIRVNRSAVLQIIRVRDAGAEVLVSSRCDFTWDQPVTFDVALRGCEITATVGASSIVARDETKWAFKDGGVGLFVFEGAISADAIDISPASD
jgi:hypothetical protein